MALRGRKPSYRPNDPTPEEILRGNNPSGLKKPTADQLLADQMAEFYDDPLGHVMFSYDWDNDVSIQMVRLAKRFRDRFNSEFGPDEWNCDFLDDIGAEVRARGFNGRDAVPPIRFCGTSGHGIGKTTTVAFISNWLKDTRPHCHVTVTANTADQLKTKTWGEIIKWKKKAPTDHWFHDSSSRGHMEIRHKDHLDWYVHAQTCREENSEAFAGQHAANSTSAYINDEGSAIPDKIYEVEEGGLTDGEPHQYIFGNPTRNTGKMYRIFTDPVFTKPIAEGGIGYKTIQIDSRTVSITNKEKIQQDVDAFGEDSDFVRVRWRGLFPKQDAVQFLSAEKVKRAQQRFLPDCSRFRRAMGVDCAGFGDGDEFVIATRKGPDARTFPYKRYLGLGFRALIDKVIDEYNFFQRIGDPVEKIFMDITGGYGHAQSQELADLGYPVVAVNFGWTATNFDDYVQVCDELWGRGRDAIEDWLCLPAENDSDWRHAGTDTAKVLATQLTDRWAGTTEAGQTKMESKKDLKKRVGYSPDVADGVLLTFFQELGLKDGHEGDPAGRPRQNKSREVDPIDEEFA